VTEVRVVLAVARLFLWVREATRKNDGPPVEAIQQSTGNAKGDAWCASFVYFVGRVLNGLGSKWPLPRTASCDELLEFARRKNVLRREPQPGLLGLVMRAEHDAIHVYFVTGLTGATHTTIEGNTNPDGGREGYGVFERERGGIADPTLEAGLWYAFIDWPALLAA
jgi:hypothetical protein